MISRRTRVVAVVLLAIVLGGAGGRAGSLDLGCEIGSLDVTGTLPRVPVALGAASDELLTFLAGQGMPPAELADLAADFDSAIADLHAVLTTFPPMLPIPLLGVGFEIPLRLVVVDALSVSVGALNGAMIRGIAAAADIEIPDPLIDEEFALDGEVARFTLDADFSVWTLSVEAVKRFDVVVAALNVAAGIDYTSGGAALLVGHDLPEEWAMGVDSALAELHLDELHWAALAAHIGARLEFGLPFLRLYAEARLVQPLVEWVGWWDLHVGGFSGSIGVVIRF